MLTPYLGANIIVSISEDWLFLWLYAEKPTIIEVALIHVTSFLGLFHDDHNDSLMLLCIMYVTFLYFLFRCALA